MKVLRYMRANAAGALLLVLIFVCFAALVGIVAPAFAATSTAPENVKVKVICWNSNGTEVVRHWDFIGTGSYGDSPMRDGMNSQTLTIDGGCGLSNAVIIGP